MPPTLQRDLNFDGATVEAVDRERLMGQLAHVLALMSDGKWRTLKEIAGEKYSEAGVSARLRDLRKAKWGSYTVDRRRRGEVKSGLFEYMVTK